LAGNKISEQKQDPMASFHKGPMPLRGVKGHTTTTTTTTIYTRTQKLSGAFLPSTPVS
jgi:hypothetical protein